VCISKAQNYLAHEISGDSNIKVYLDNRFTDVKCVYGACRAVLLRQWWASALCNTCLV